VTALEAGHATDIVRSRDLRVVFATSVAHMSGCQHVHELEQELQFALAMHCSEVLGEPARLPASKGFLDAEGGSGRGRSPGRRAPRSSQTRR
jgi:hypothetical protein